MKEHLTSTEIIRILKEEKGYLHSKFGVVNIGLFGSYVAQKQKTYSDIDILIELKEPRFDWFAGLQNYLEQKFDKKVEIIRKSPSIKGRFFERIEENVIYA